MLSSGSNDGKRLSGPNDIVVAWDDAVYLTDNDLRPMRSISTRTPGSAMMRYEVKARVAQSADRWRRAEAADLRDQRRVIARQLQSKLFGLP